MIPRFVPTVNPTSLLDFNEDNFIELAGTSSSALDGSTFYSFNVVFYLRNSQKLTSYEKVVVTVKKKNTQVLGGVVVTANPFATNSQTVGSNDTSRVPLVNSTSLNENFSLDLPVLRTSVENRAYSGLQIDVDSRRPDDFIQRKEIPIVVDSSYLNRVYTVFSLRNDSVPLPSKIGSPLLNPLNTSELIKIVNEELTDPTESVDDKFGYTTPLSSPVGETDLDLRARNKGKTVESLYSKIAKYYIDGTARRPGENQLTRYEIANYSSKLNRIDFNTQIRLSESLKSENLELRFELYERNNTVPIETIVKNFDMSRHIEAFQTIKYPPTVSGVYDGRLSRVFLGISDDQRNLSNVKKFSIYVKDVKEDGTVTQYRRVGEVDNNNRVVSYNFSVNTPVSIVRVVPISSFLGESNIYTNKVIGESFRRLGVPVITCRPSPVDLYHSITIHNIPRGQTSQSPGATTAILKRRYSIDNSFEDVKIVGVPSSGDSFTIDDITNYDPGSKYVEYTCTINFSDNLHPVTALPVVVQNVRSSLAGNSISVKLTDIKRSFENNDFVVSFKINTRVLPQENERIINTFKDDPKYKEIYDQFVSPSNNSQSAVGSDGYTQTVYSDLYVHQVVRTNLKTGERSSFDITSGTDFRDDEESRSLFGITPLNPQQEYLYQVMTYVKDPVTLMRKYVKKVKDKDGRFYYYAPYKWENPAFSPTMPERDNDDLPIIDVQANLTSSPLGETASITVSGLGDFSSISYVNTQRIDRNTIKVSWDFNVANYQEFYDGFVVMKTVNGSRSFVGRTRLNYIYHELDRNDLGTIYYTVVPITKEFDIDNVEHSEPFTIETPGILDPIAQI